jgi:methyl-accepting chemotaxis protein
MIRHPDMPEEAFRDLWHDLQKGISWEGLVKNRRKDGSFYWVKANIVPIYENDEHVGYMSVRSKAPKNQIEKASLAYEKINTQTQKILFIQHGRVKQIEGWSLKSFWHKLTIQQRFIILALVVSLACSSFLFYAIKLNDDDNSRDIKIREQEKTQISDLYVMQQEWRSIVYILEIAKLSQNTDKYPLYTKDIKAKLHAISKVMLDNLVNNDLGAQHKKEQLITVADLHVADKKLETDYINPILATFASNSNLDKSFLNEAQTKINLFLAELQLVIHRNEEDIFKKYAFQNKSNQQNNAMLMLTALLFMVIILYGFVRINAYIQDVIIRIKTSFLRLAQSDYLFEIDDINPDELGDVLQALRIMKVQLGYNMELVREEAKMATRVKVALDSVSTNVMIADNDRNIIYVNPAVIEMLNQAKEALLDVVPNFDASKLVGTNIDQFHKNPEHQKHILKTFTETHSVEVAVSNRIFGLITNPVINEQGERLGSVVEWLDRTNQIAIEQEVAQVVKKAIDGDLGQRMSLEGKNAFFTQLCENINNLLETNETSLKGVITVLQALSQGDLTQKITQEYQGAFADLKDCSNLTVQKLKNMIQQIQQSTNTINIAVKEIAIGNVDLSQRTEQQACTLEETAASMEELTATVKQNAENAKAADQLAISVSREATKGGEIVGEVVKSMQAINSSSKKIMDIISVIDGIAFQTNILALNAAVEAARAGEQGRGFAVVAAEVRNLAQRSAKAAKEVKTLIGNSVDKVDLGTKLADKAGHSMGSLVESITEVTGLINDITVASVEQSAGLDQVSRTLLQMDDATQQNSALVEEAATAAQSLEAEVANLAISVAVFDVTKDGFDSSVCPIPQNKTKKTQAKTQTLIDEDDWSEF